MACVAAMLGVVIWAAAPASVGAATAIHASQADEFDTWQCGYPMHVAVDAQDTVVLREDAQGVVVVNDRFQVTETWTNANGAFFTLERNGLQKDFRPTQVDGSVYRFTHQFSGQTAIVTDSAGNLVYRDRGNLSYSYLLDIATGESTFLEIGKVAGKYPSLSVEMCKAVAPLVGTDSARYLTPRPIGSTGFPMGFYEYLPPSYSPTGAKSPLLIALNGYGENGDGTPGALVWLLNAGIPRLIDIGGWPTERPLVVLALQHVVEGSNYCTTADEVHDLITYALASYNVDPARVYVTGLSCGGTGAWDYAAEYLGQQVAAVIPIAGDGRAAWSRAECALGAVAFWAFHSADDPIVDPAGSIEPMTSLAACPGVTPERAQLTVYDLGLGHGGWDEAYSGSQGQDIYSWMLSFSKP